MHWREELRLKIKLKSRNSAKVSIVLCFYTVELPAGRLTKSAKLELIDKVFHEHDLVCFQYLTIFILCILTLVHGIASEQL